MDNDEFDEVDSGDGASFDDTYNLGAEMNRDDEGNYGNSNYQSANYGPGPGYNDNLNYNSGMNYNDNMNYSNMNHKQNNSYYGRSYGSMGHPGVGGFFTFDKMITPSIIKIVFYLGIIASIISGLAMIFSGINAYYGGGVQVFTGILTIVFMPIVVRIYCELLIVIFKIHESLIEIKNK